MLANQEVLHIIAERCILAASEGGAQRWHGLAGRRAMPRLFGPRLLAAVALLSVALKAHGAQLRTPGTPLIIADGYVIANPQPAAPHLHDVPQAHVQTLHDCAYHDHESPGAS